MTVVHGTTIVYRGLVTKVHDGVTTAAGPRLRGQCGCLQGPEKPRKERRMLLARHFPVSAISSRALPMPPARGSPQGQNIHERDTASFKTKDR